MDKKTDSIIRRILYGMGDIYGAGSFIILNAIYLHFLTDVQEIPPVLAATIPMVAKIWDSVQDPFMAMLADRTQSRLGGRRVYFLLGSLVTSISFILMWSSFGISDSWGRYFYFVFVYMLFGTAITIVEIPYNSILPEMVPDYQKRNGFITWKTIFAVGASIISGFIPSLLLTILPDYFSVNDSYLVMGTIFGVLFGVSWLAVFFGTWENPNAIRSAALDRPFDYFKRMLTVFKNQSYRRYFGMYLAGISAVDVLIALFIYFLTGVMQRGDQYYLILGTMVGVQFISVPIYYLLARIKGKNKPLLIGLPIWMIGMMLGLFVNSDTSIWILLGFAALAGFGSASISYTNNLILPDLSDVDELITSERREGVYAGMSFFARKLTGAFIIGLIGVFLQLVRYDGTLPIQLPYTQSGIRILFVVLPTLLMAITLFFAHRYKLNEKKFNIMMLEIYYRRAHSGDSVATEETKQVCEEVTGINFKDLWKK